MPDADSALRAEIEKVRDRARLQALAQGVSTDEADRRGQKAVDDFCGKWGIRPEMVGTIATATGVTECHLSARHTLESAMQFRRNDIPMGAAAVPGEYERKEASAALIRTALVAGASQS